MEEIRKITKNGRGTYYVSIPKEMLQILRIKERQKVIVKLKGESIIINDWKPKK